MHETIEDFDNMEKLGQGFSLIDQLKILILVMQAFQVMNLSVQYMEAEQKRKGKLNGLFLYFG